MKISILGDSISTYKGVSNDAAANEKTGINPSFYRLPFPLERTYWMRVIRALGAELCVNNSWSGGNLCGEGDPSSGLNRASALSRDDGARPDLIILFMGINDLGRRVDADVFSRDYKRTLARIAELYPAAAVCCVNIPDRDPVLKARAECFNAIIGEAALEAGGDFFVADLFGSRLKNDLYYVNTVDGLHPDEDGMAVIAEVVIGAIKRHFSVLS